MTLLELYGTRPQIHTSYPTRQHPDCVHPRREVQCPTCKTWSDLTHNSFCTSCNLWLVDEQPTPAVVVTEPAVSSTAAPQVVASIEASECATQAEPVATEPYPGQCDDCPGSAHALCCRNTLSTPEQEALIAELSFDEDAEVDRERHIAIRSGKYVLWCRRDSMMAVDCSCPSRVKRNRLAGKACKHQMAHNDTLKPVIQQEAA